MSSLNIFKTTKKVTIIISEVSTPTLEFHKMFVCYLGGKGMFKSIMPMETRYVSNKRPSCDRWVHPMHITQNMKNLIIIINTDRVNINTCYIGAVTELNSHQTNVPYCRVA